MARKSHPDSAMVSVEMDITEPIMMLQKLGARKTQAMKRMLGKIGTAAKAPVRKAYRSTGLHRRTGALYRSIRSKVMRSGAAVVVSAGALRDGKVLYGYALAKGSVIDAGKGKLLAFQIDGKWVRTRKVTLPKRDFVEAPVRSYLSSPAFKAKLDQIVNKEIERIAKEKSR